MASLLTHIKDPQHIMDNISTEVFSHSLIMSNQYLNFTLNGRTFEDLNNQFPGFDKYLPKIIYENPDNHNELIIDGTYINYTGKNGSETGQLFFGFPTLGGPDYQFTINNRVIILRNPDLNKLRTQLKYDSIKFVNCTKGDPFITFDIDANGGGIPTIEDFKFDFIGTGSTKLVINHNAIFKNCTFGNRVTINFDYLQEVTIKRMEPITSTILYTQDNYETLLALLSNKFIRCDFGIDVNTYEGNGINLLSINNKWFADITKNQFYPRIPYKFYIDNGTNK